MKKLFRYLALPVSLALIPAFTLTSAFAAEAVKQVQQESGIQKSDFRSGHDQMGKMHGEKGDWKHGGRFHGDRYYGHGSYKHHGYGDRWGHGGYKHHGYAHCYWHHGKKFCCAWRHGYKLCKSCYWHHGKKFCRYLKSYRD